MRFGRLMSAVVLTGLAALAACSSRSSISTASLTWTHQSPANSPLARTAAPMVYDPDIGKIVLFGGAPLAPPPDLASSLLNDTWTYDGTTWTKQSPGSSPAARFSAVMAYDPKIRRVVLFGGVGSNVSSGSSDSYPVRVLTDTWTFDGTTWTQRHPATSPSVGGVMAYDAAIGQIVLCGKPGQSRAGTETWRYDGYTWTEQQGAGGPGAESGDLTMAYDARLQRIVLLEHMLGDYSSSTVTWTYDGTRWTREAPPANPQARFGGSMAYDPAISQTVLFGGVFGGYRTNYDLNDTWTYDGTTWTKQAPSASPPPRGVASMAYDPSLKSLVLFGGNNYVSDTWIYGPNAGK